MATLNLAMRLLIYRDAGGTSDPKLRNLDERIAMDGVAVGRPLEYPLDPPIPAGGSVTVFDGTRTIGWDGTTQLALTTSSLGADRYRLTWTTTGTNPAFRVERALAASGSTLLLTLNSNLTITITGSGPTYSAVQVGDEVLIPGAATGDAAGPFSAVNVGRWTVLAASSTSVTIVRAAGWAGATGEAAVAVTTNDQLIAMAPDRVQVGDQLEVLGGFSANARRVYAVAAVAPRWVDVRSTVALAPETAIAGANGLAVYSAARKILIVQVDQLVSVRLNGATDDVNPVEPLTAADGSRLGLLVKTGPVWKCVIFNKSSVAVSGQVVAAP